MFPRPRFLNSETHLCGSYCSVCLIPALLYSVMAVLIICNYPRDPLHERNESVPKSCNLRAGIVIFAGSFRSFCRDHRVCSNRVGRALRKLYAVGIGAEHFWNGALVEWSAKTQYAGCNGDRSTTQEGKPQ